MRCASVIKHELLDLRPQAMIASKFYLSNGWAQACVLPMIFTCLLQVWLRGRNGRSENDLSLPYGNDDSEELAEQIRQDFNAGKDLVFTVTKVSLLSSSCN